MEGKALTWYQWWKFCAGNSTWENLKAAIIRRFEPSILQNPSESLPSLKQMGTVEEYREQFELYAGPLVWAEREHLKAIFLNGLKDVVKAELKLHPVNSLPEMMDYAQRIDEKNFLINKGTVAVNKGGSFPRSHPTNRTVMWESINKLSLKTKSVGNSSIGESTARG